MLSHAVNLGGTDVTTTREKKKLHCGDGYIWNVLCEISNIVGLYKSSCKWCKIPNDFVMVNSSLNSELPS